MRVSSSVNLPFVFPSVKRGVLKSGFTTMVDVLVSACLILVAFTSPAMAVLTAEELLKALPLSDGERKDVLKGEIVRFTTEEGSDRELALGAVLLVPKVPENLVPLWREAVVFKLVGAVTAFGEIPDKATVGDFAGVKLQPNGEEEAKRYLEAEPGEMLNLDGKEISAFQALKAKGGSLAEVETLVREQLLARYQAYREKGLAGIPPYARGKEEMFQLSQDLVLATNAAKLVAKYFPSFQEILLKYPAIQAKQLETRFNWANVEVFSRPTLILSHRMLFNEGDAYVVVDRHFYASHEYNGLQSIGGALPAEEGSLLVSLYRISTDGVAGFGSSAKHPVARGLMGPYFEEIFEGIRKKAK
ncbi:MAG: hypothetical protein MRJ67_16490 [Nitrospirales bacterium]|nr:hypothetical protein [Nitrospira sp.]MDR4462090.1 hypothetical protein [Nitrospirales bacterium]MDR4482289.1 hypothetical protein [Nitrospirales bacterium]